MFSKANGLQGYETIPTAVFTTPQLRFLQPQQFFALQGLFIAWD
jgi:hypothetical protein